MICWLGERKISDISGFWICELSWDKAVYYQRECFSQEKGKKWHSVLLSLCRKCYWKLRVRRLPKFLEGHLVCFIFCVTSSCGCRLSYAYVPCSFLMFEGALCYPPEMKMHKWNWTAFWVVRWFSGQIRLFFSFFLFSCWHFFFKVPIEIGCIAWTACLVLMLLFWLPIYDLDNQACCKLCWRHCLFVGKCVKGWIDSVASCTSSRPRVDCVNDLNYSVKLGYLYPCNAFRNTVYVEMFLTLQVPQSSWWEGTFLKEVL